MTNINGPIAFGFALGAIFTVAAFDYWHDKNLDQGLATLVAGLIGFAAVAWQVRKGLESQRETQKQQAILSRESLQAQADASIKAISRQHELAQKMEEAARHREMLTLSAALRGELVAAANSCLDAKNSINLMLAISEVSAKAGSREKVDVLQLPKCGTAVFKSNADKIGLFGASIACDLAIVYSHIEHFSKAPSIKIEPQGAKPFFDFSLKAADMYWGQFMHVASRLKALEFGQQDPGTLYEFSKKQKASNEAETKTAPSSQ